jgi:multidrug resistance efflux pump
MSYTTTQLDALKRALATGERRVSFGDKTVEYRSVEELQEAIRTVEAELARSAGAPSKRQIRVTTAKGF